MTTPRIITKSFDDVVELGGLDEPRLVGVEPTEHVMPGQQASL